MGLGLIFRCLFSLLVFCMLCFEVCVGIDFLGWVCFSVLVFNTPTQTTSRTEPNKHKTITHTRPNLNTKLTKTLKRGSNQKQQTQQPEIVATLHKHKHNKTPLVESQRNYIIVSSDPNMNPR